MEKYFFVLFTDKTSNENLAILTVNATDADSEKNAMMEYSLVKPMPGFSIGETTGILYVNTSRTLKVLKNDIQLSVMVTDSGAPPMKSVTTVRIHVNSNGLLKPQFIQNQYRFVIL